MIRPGQSVGIVGGGWLGVTLALRLAEAGVVVTMFEAAPELGGLTASWSIPTPTGDVTWDRYYHVTLASDRALRRLLADVGLDDAIAWTSTKTGYFSNGRLSPVSTPREFLALPGLSPLAKFRLAATILRGRTVRDWRRLEAMTVERWLTRWSGAETFRRFWVPLLEAKLGDAWTDANAAFIWATIQRLTAARRADIREERFGAVPGGYAHVLATIAARLTELGATVALGVRVARVEQRADARVAVTTDATSEDFDHVIITTTPRAAAALCPQLEDATRARMTAVRYRGVVCASVVLRRPLSPYYLTYLMDELPFTAIVEMTTMIPPTWVGGYTLVYLPRYCAPDDPMFEAPDAEIEAAFLAGLRDVHAVAPDDVVAVRIARAREVFPVPVREYSALVPPIATGLSGVHFVSSAQIINGTLNVNETVTRAELALTELGVHPAPATRQ